MDTAGGSVCIQEGGVPVTLLWHEIYMGATIGVTRRIASLRLAGTNRVQNRDFGWHSDIESACAEVVVAKHLGVFWDGSVGTFKLPDVCEIQVRHTQYETGKLIVRPSDADDQIFCLVTGTHPTYMVRGWLAGHEAKKRKYLMNPGMTYEAWFVPQDKLRPIETITGCAKEAATLKEGTVS